MKKFGFLVLVALILSGLMGKAQRHWKNVNLKNNGSSWCTMLADGDVWWDSGKGNVDYNRFSNIVVGDFDGNGYQDVSSLYSYSENLVAVFVWLSNGNKFTFVRWLNPVKDRVLYSRISNFRVGDFNNDGKSDVKFTYNYGTKFQDFILYSDGSKFGELVKAN